MTESKRYNRREMINVVIHTLKGNLQILKTPRRKTLPRKYILNPIAQRFFTTMFLIIKKKKYFPFSEVFKETIAAFKRLNRFSISICQNKEHEGLNILVPLTKKFDKIFLAFQKSRFTQNTLLQHYVTLMQH